METVRRVVDLDCEGCGELVPVDLEFRVSTLRETDGREAGRVVVRQDDLVVHRCADGAWLPPGQLAPRRVR